MNVLYPAYFEYDKKEQLYTVKFVDLPEAITEGNNLEDAYFNASEVLTLTLEGRMEEGLEIPVPSLPQKDHELISPSVRVQAALLMRMAKGKNHSVAEIARALDTSWAAASRLENPRHWPSLRQLERAAASLGQEVIISLKPAHTAQSH